MISPSSADRIEVMRTEADRVISCYLVSFGLPIVLVLRGQWWLGIIGAIIFFAAYFLLPKIKLLRREVPYLDIYVSLSYFIIFVGCWILYSNGYDNTYSIWLYIGIGIIGIPFFYKVLSYLKRNLQDC